MPPFSYIRIKNTAGVVKAVLGPTGRDGGDNGFLYLAWKQRVNDIYFAEFALNTENPDLEYVQDKYQLEVIRSYPEIGLSEYTALNAIIRDDIPFIDDQGRSRVLVRAYGGNSLPARRRIAYPPNVAGLTEFTGVKGETVLKTIVKYNCDPAFTSSGGVNRDRVANTINLALETDGLRGATINWVCGGRTNVLEEIRKVALIAGGDFNTVQTGATTYEFRFYPGQLGTDRSTGADKIVFAIDRGNMKAPRFPRIRSAEKTVAIVGGKGEGTDRVIRIRTGPNYSATNDIETFIDGRNTATTTSLDSLGDQGLQELKFRNVLEYTVLQSPLYALDKDYFLGDLVIARHLGVDIVQQVYETTIAYKGPKENIDIVMKDR